MKITAKVVPYSSVVGSSVTLHAESGMTICQLSLLSVIPPNFTFTPELHKQTSTRIAEWVASAINGAAEFDAASALENSPAALADATNSPPLSDLSSLRKGAEVAVKPLEWREVNPDCHLAATPFGSIRVYRDGTWYGQWSTEGDEQSADFGAAKAAAQADYEARILSAIASDATPAPTSGSEDGGDWRPVLTEMVAAMNRYGHEIGDGDIPSAHRSLMWRAEQLLAKPASEPAGGDVERGWLIELKGAAPSWAILNPRDYDEHWTTDSARAIRFAREGDAQAYIDHIGWTEAFPSEHIWDDGRAALSSSAGPAVKMPSREWLRDKIASDPDDDEGEARPAGPVVGAVAWRYRSTSTAIWNYCEGSYPRGVGAEIVEPLYAHPAPATVEMREDRDDG